MNNGDLKEFANILFAPSERDEYKRRIDKAIEYIPKIIVSGKSEHSFNEFAVDFQQTKEGKILLDILKGNDSNERIKSN